MALADKWSKSGGNLSKAYSAPTMADEAMRSLASYGQQAAAGQKAVTNDESQLAQMQFAAKEAELNRQLKDISNKTKKEKPPEKISEGQRKAAVFARRAKMASDILESMPYESLTSRSVNIQKGNFFPSELMSKDAKKIDQAERNFVNAILREESGAAISESEFANARQQYFPQPGDSQEVLNQKAENRKVAVEGFRLRAGRAYDELLEQTPAEKINSPEEIKPAKKLTVESLQQMSEEELDEELSKLLR
jgi:hypothetical protein